MAKMSYVLMRESVKTLPQLLFNLPAKQQLIVCRQFPYSVGIEWEIASPDYDPEINILSNLGLRDLRVSSSEFRVRLRSGIDGLVQLYKVAEYLKATRYENYASGIHYHIDCTDLWNYSLFSDFAENQDWILDSLRSWNYTGGYNRWVIGSNKEAVRLHAKYRTIEFRIGEMTFDYELLVKRIKHCQAITQRLKYLYNKRVVNNKLIKKIIAYDYIYKKPLVVEDKNGLKLTVLRFDPNDYSILTKEYRWIGLNRVC